MEENYWHFVKALVPENYLRQAVEASTSNENLIRHLLQHKSLPVHGWDDILIQKFLYQLSSMDSNNFRANCGLGEREARFASKLVAQRHYYFGHGIGRSGNLTEAQPKAVGSTLMYNLANRMFKDLFKLMGLKSQIECLIVPVATGMALILSVLTCKSLRPNAKYVLWSRIDQKSCFKCITAAGFIPIVIDMLQCGDQLVTDTSLVERKIKNVGADNILCFMSTTSCFAPRACDDITSLSSICKKYGIPHLINNAYGLQSAELISRIEKASRKGRVDIIVQSTDKNLMVPVGGAVIVTFDKQLLDTVAGLYPGRASLTPILDSFITLLTLGENGYKQLTDKRIQLYKYLHEQLTNVAKAYGERILQTPDNYISIAMTLSIIPKNDLTKLGSMLYWRSVSGTRVVTGFETKKIANYEFNAWGTHSTGFTIPYLTAAATIGIEKADVDLFIKRLHKVMLEFTKNKKVNE